MLLQILFSINVKRDILRERPAPSVNAKSESTRKNPLHSQNLVRLDYLRPCHCTRVCVPILHSIATYMHSRTLVPCSNADATNNTIQNDSCIEKCVIMGSGGNFLIDT